MPRASFTIQPVGRLGVTAGSLRLRIFLVVLSQTQPYALPRLSLPQPTTTSGCAEAGVFTAIAILVTNMLVASWMLLTPSARPYAAPAPAGSHSAAKLPTPPDTIPPSFMLGAPSRPN